MLSDPPITRDLVRQIDAELVRLESLASIERRDLELLANAICRAASASAPNNSEPAGTLLYAAGRCGTPTQKDLVHAAIARLVASTTFTDPRLIARLVEWFPQVSKRLRLTKTSQNYEVIAAFRSTVVDAGAGALAIANRADISTMLGSELTLTIRTLAADATRSFVCPFIEPILIRSAGLLPTLARQVNEYAAADVRVAHETLECCRGTFRAILASTESGTQYERAIAVMTTALMATLEDHFLHSPANAPVQLRLQPADKRYPLHESGREIELVIHVANESFGAALDATVVLEAKSPAVVLLRDYASLGTIQNSSIEIDFAARVLEPISEFTCQVIVTWRDPAGNQSEREQTLTFEAQSATVDWAAAALRNPYSLEPIAKIADFVGRRQELDNLVAHLNDPAPNSLILWGQKRIGKTSLANALRERLGEISPDFLVIATQAGDFTRHSPLESVRRLTELIATELETIGASSPKSPKTDDISLALLVPQLKSMAHRKLCLFIDDFDDIQPDLYLDQNLALPLFLSLRALTAHVRVVLIGGERMKLILARQGTHLNKFLAVQLRALEKKNWTEFCELVSRPGDRILSISESAYKEIWDQTGGHPFFTRLLCREIYKRAANSRDAHVAVRDVRLVAQALAHGSDLHVFSHYWDDGYDVALRSARPTVMLAIAKLLRGRGTLSEGHIVQNAIGFGSTEMTARRTVAEYVQREVLVERGTKDALECAVRLLGDWLRERGYFDMFVVLQPETIPDDVAAEATTIKPDELVNLVGRWGTYCGKDIGTDVVRTWLRQFGSGAEQRAMFQLLRGVRFYSDALINEKLAELHKYVERDFVRPSPASLMHPINSGGRKRSDILITYSGGAGKSGASLARRYAQRNEVVIRHVVERPGVGEMFRKSSSEPFPRAVVCVDDLLGSGGTAVSSLRDLRSDVPAGVPIYFLAVVATTWGLEAVAEAKIANVVVRAADTVGEADRCFHASAGLFETDVMRELAMNLCSDHRPKVARGMEFGYENSQILVVFQNECPNNAPAVLWCKQPNWFALFPRSA